MDFREPVKIIADILSHQMNLDPSRIFIYNDGRTLPKDDGLYIVLYVHRTPPYGSKTEYKETAEGLIEVQSLNFQQTIIASAVSKSTEARQRAYEVQMAVNSTYSQQMQEKYGCHISRIAPVQDLSFLETTSRLNRFDTTVVVLAAVEKETVVDYYDQFPYESQYEQ